MVEKTGRGSENGETIAEFADKSLNAMPTEMGVDQRAQPPPLEQAGGCGSEVVPHPRTHRGSFGRRGLQMGRPDMPGRGVGVIHGPAW